MSQRAALSWTLAVSPPQWLEVPAGGLDAVEWRRDAALVFELLDAVDSKLAESAEIAVAKDAPLEIEAAIDSLLEFAHALPSGHHLVAGMTIPGRWPLPVVIEVKATSDEPQDLLQAAGARGGRAIELPILDYLPEHLGDGIRVTRFDLDDAGAVWATVSCARRTEGIDTVLTWRTTDLELVPLFSLDLESLLGAVRIEDAA